MISDIRYLKIFGLASASVLMLAACQNPSSIPTGYAWHQGEYKSPPGEAPQNLGYSWSARKNAESAAHWRVAARDIVEKIIISSGAAIAPVYLEPSRERTPFTTTFDNYLREELLKAGFALAAVPGDGPVLRYDVGVVDESKAGSEEKPEMKDVETMAAGVEETPLLPMEEAPPVMLTGSEVTINANISSNDLVLAAVTGTYHIPEAAEYNYREPLYRAVPIVGKR